MHIQRLLLSTLVFAWTIFNFVILLSVNHSDAVIHYSPYSGTKPRYHENFVYFWPAILTKGIMDTKQISNTARGKINARRPHKVNFLVALDEVRKPEGSRNHNGKLWRQGL